MSGDASAGTGSTAGYCVNPSSNLTDTMNIKNKDHKKKMFGDPDDVLPPRLIIQELGSGLTSGFGGKQNYPDRSNVGVKYEETGISDTSGGGQRKY